MGQIDFYAKFADYYSKLVLDPVVRGESCIFTWFPGAGKTSIVNNIFSSSDLLKTKLGKLYSRLKVINLVCSLAEDPDAVSVLKLSGWDTKVQLINAIKSEIDNGNEILFVIDRLEALPDHEVEKLFQLLADIKTCAPHRILFSIHITNKPLIESLITKHSKLANLVHVFQDVPLASDRFLKKFTDDFAKVKNTKADNVLGFSGGILLLTKEFIRSGPESSLFKAKALSIWNQIPIEYRSSILANPRKSEYLRKFNAEKLSFFANAEYFSYDPADLIKRWFSSNEVKFWQYIKNRPNKLVSKELVGELLWEDNLETKYSDWAIDQYISRFRKKLLECGIESEKLKTVKGKGYIWLE